MLRKLFLGAAVAVTALVMSDTANADHNRCYRGGGYGGGYGAVYRAPVINYGYGGYRSGYRGFSSPYRSFYGSPYRSFYGGGFGYGAPYYGRGGGTYIGIGRGGVSLGFGF